MEDIGSSTSTPESDHKKTSLVSGMKRGCLYFAVSLQESFRYVKAFFVGQVRNPKPFFICSVVPNTDFEFQNYCRPKKIKFQTLFDGRRVLLFLCGKAGEDYYCKK